MNNRVRRVSIVGILVAVVVVAIGLSVVYAALQPVLFPREVVTQDFDAAPAPSITQDELPKSEDPRPSNRITQPATPTPSTKAPTLVDPRGLPTKVEVFNGGKRLLTMKMDKDGTVNGNPFESPCGQTTWYAAQGWPTPGTLSTQKSLITGHMRCGGDYYEINQLQGSTRDAILRVTFSSGDVVIAEATMKATSVKKTELNESKKNLYNEQPDRVIRLSTCDDDSPVIGGYARDNLYQMFDVVEVIRKK